MCRHGALAARQSASEEVENPNRDALPMTKAPISDKRIAKTSLRAGTFMRSAGFEPATRGLEVRRFVHTNAGSVDACPSHVSFAFVTSSYQDRRVTHCGRGGGLGRIHSQ